MRKGISKLLLITISLISFSAQAVSIGQVLDASDNLSAEDQSEILFKTAVIEAIDVNRALGLDSDRSLWVTIPVNFAVAFFSLKVINMSDDFIDILMPESVSHLRQEKKVRQFRNQLNTLNVERVKNNLNHAGAEVKNLWSLKRTEVQKTLEEAKNDLRFLRSKRGFTYKLGRVFYGLKGLTVTLVLSGTIIAVMANCFYVIFHSEEDMIRLQKEYQKDVESLISKSENF